MIRFIFSFTIAIISLALFACGDSNQDEVIDPAIGEFADVVAVTVNGEGGDYSFTVTISSPDKSCEQYADWWEVIDEEGSLLYRRILGHSHVNEQPFTRSGGPVAIAADQSVWIRAHMNNTGYGGATFFGSQNSVFEIKQMPEGFAQNLDQAEPLPDGCAF